jgi:hypothetical protein
MKKCIFAASLMAVLGFGISANAATVLYEGRTIEVEQTLDDPVNLWVTPADLTKINGFVIKPEGACLDEICIPLTEQNQLSVTRLGQQWINLTKLAQVLKQPYASDSASKVWSFAPIPAKHESYLQTAVAPDFELKDRSGKTVRLSDYKGKKVLLMTWASW